MSAVPLVPKEEGLHVTEGRTCGEALIPVGMLADPNVQRPPNCLVAAFPLDDRAAWLAVRRLPPTGALQARRRNIRHSGSMRHVLRTTHNGALPGGARISDPEFRLAGDANVAQWSCDITHTDARCVEPALPPFEVAAAFIPREKGATTMCNCKVVGQPAVRETNPRTHLQHLRPHCIENPGRAVHPGGLSRETHTAQNQACYQEAQGWTYEQAPAPPPSGLFHVVIRISLSRH